MAAPNPLSDGVNLKDSQQSVTLRAIIPFAVVAILCVIGRFAARKVQKLRFEFDDWMMVVALAFTLGCFALSCEMVHLGSGKHLGAVDPKNIPTYFKCLFAYEFIYASAILALKLSVLSFYRRVFSTRKFKLVANIIGAVCVAWWIAVILVSIFSCNPIQGFWDHTIKSKCINTENFFIGNAVPTIITDVIILFLPIRMIWNLQTSRKQKIALSFIFLLGGFAVVASLVRLVAQFKVHDPDFTWAMNGTVIWTSIEPSIAVITACLPTMRPLVLRLFPKRASKTTFMPSHKISERSGNQWSMIMDTSPPESQGIKTTASSHPKNFDPEHDDMLLGNIRVQKDVDIRIAASAV